MTDAALDGWRRGFRSNPSGWDHFGGNLRDSTETLLRSVGFPLRIVSAFAALGFLLALFVLSHRLLLLLLVPKLGLPLFLGRLFRLLLAVWTHKNLGEGRPRKRRT